MKATPGTGLLLSGQPVNLLGGPLWIRRTNEGLTTASLAPTVDYPLVLEAQDSVIYLASLREGDHGSGIQYAELFPAGTLVDSWFIGKSSSNASFGPGSSIIWEYGTNPDYALNARRFEFTKWGQIVVGGTSGANRYASAAASSIVMESTAAAVATAFLDTFARINGLVILATEPRIQLISDNSGAAAAMLILSAGNLATNLHWLVTQRGGASADPNSFDIQTNTSVADADVAAGAVTVFSIGRTGIVTVTTVDNGIAVTGQTSGAGALAGTLANAPSAGNPSHWLRVRVNGANRFIPCWT